MLIGISGKKGSGKSTIRKHLRAILRTYGTRTYWHPFAMPLKLEAIAAGATYAQVFGPDKEEWRGWLQNRGQEARESDPDYWINQHALTCPAGVVIADDLRYQNELDYIRSRGIAFRLTRWDGVVDNHPSETELDDADGMIYIPNEQLGIQRSAYHMARIIQEYVCRGQRLT